VSRKFRYGRKIDTKAATTYTRDCDSCERCGCSNNQVHETSSVSRNTLVEDLSDLVADLQNELDSLREISSNVDDYISDISSIVSELQS
jgi:hypothetical protein